MTDRPAGAPSLFEDLLDILYKPAEVFARRRETVAFGAAIVVLSVLTAAVLLATRSAFEPALEAMAKQQIAEVMRQNPTLTEAQIAPMRGMMRTGTLVSMAVYPAIAPFLIGLLLWVAGKFFESRAGIGAAIMVAAYGYVPRFVGFIAASIMAVLLPEGQVTSLFSLSLSPARFMDPGTSAGVLGAAARLDVFLLWQTVVCGIGMSVMGQVSRGRGMAIAFIVWALGFIMLIPALVKG
ncbi:MAG: YIP1 family protein [Gemmatimonadales bacterium]|nr:YIP1 family protein [Gemmatimonadales bacterium]